MAFATINKGSSYFNTLLYTGNGSARTITGVGFQPDWVWVKDRTSANSHYLYDVLRGNNLNLFTNDTSAEVNVTTGQNGGGVGSQASDGFTIVAGLVNTNNVNTNNNLYASWNWLANGAGVSNTAGTISSTVSANTTAGFSIVSYTGTGANATVGHGLGVAPKMIIFKSRNSATSWPVYHASLGATNFVALSNTDASSASSLVFNNTAPTSSVFSLGSSGGTNSTSMIAYCFAEVKGYSKFGSYTGNGNANGTFIYTGFRPSFFLIKNTTTAGNGWHIFDNKRIGFNTSNYQLSPSSSGAEDTTTGYTDILSNGFKMRSTNDFNNKSGDTYIYMAFAENPFVLTDGTPVTAR